MQLYFPCTDAPLVPVRAKSQAMETEGGETILLVEDQDAVRELMMSVLRMCGYHFVRTIKAIVKD
jgi:hypothetical protein